MNQQRTEIAVLARFPDLSTDRQPQPRANENNSWNLLGSSGRWIGQAMSIKLLAGMTLLLLVGAVLPLCLSQKSKTADVSTADSALSTWQPKLPESPAEATSARTEAPGVMVARRPAVVVSPTSDQFPPPAKLPSEVAAPSQPSATPSVAESIMSPRPSVEARREPPPTGTTVVDLPNSSPWPSPTGPDIQSGRAGTEASASNANRGGTATRSTEYEANARGHRPGDPAAAQFEGTIEGTKR
jgi:hypothetical protein